MIRFSLIFSFITGLRMIQLTQRKSKVQNNLQSLANEAQFLVLTRSSAAELFEQTQENLESNQCVDWMIEQFRGNIIIDGSNAFEENTWKKLKFVGQNLFLDVNGLCTRCNIIGKVLYTMLAIMSCLLENMNCVYAPSFGCYLP